VFQHFDDLETLYSALVDRQLGRVRELATPIDAGVPFAARLDRYVLTRSDIYEHVTPVRRATLLAAAASPTLQRGLADAARDHARDVTAVFKPELAAFDHPGDTRAALIVATAWETWDGLRRTQRVSVTAARRVITSIVSAVLAPPAKP
jgi:TetR/AcrR family transcriptional regulator of autoinduction and epiphytic fitness